MKYSQYLFDYLYENDKRGIGKGLTPASYLAGKLKGRAKQWASRYATSLTRSCERFGAIPGRSYCGRLAYYTECARIE